MTTTSPSSTPAADEYAPPPRGGAYENVLLAVLFATFGFVFFDRLALNFLSPYFKEELGLDNADIGLLGGIPALTWAVSGLAVGYLSDRTDRRKPFLVGAVVAFTLFSTLSGLVGGFASLLLLRALMGGAEGAVLPIAQPMMIHASTPRRRGLNMGLVQGASAGLLGGILGPLVTVQLAESFGWRVAFFATVVPGAVLTLVVLRFVRDLRLRHPGFVEEVTEIGGASEQRDTTMTLAAALRTRNVVVCLAMSVFYLTWFVTTQTFAPLYLDEVKGFNSTELSLALTGIGVAWVVWGALVPGISDRIGRRPAMIGFTALAVVAPLAILGIDSPWLLFTALAVTYTGLGCFTLMMATIPAETVPPQLVATCLGLIMGVGEVVGGFIAPWVAGLLSDSFGLQVSMLISSGAAAVVLVLSFTLRETAPSRTGAVG